MTEKDAGQKREFTRRSDRIEELVHRIETSGDPAMRAMAAELLEAVIELHGVALERILEAVTELPGGVGTIDRIARDELVAGVLSLHGIHPEPLAMRVSVALEKARPYLQSHGGDVELTAIENGTVHLRLRGACGSCSGSTATLRSSVEAAIYEMAPEVVAVIAEEMPAPVHAGLVTLHPS
jgi:Fe-S cluster biogenesis protein NfuA